MSAREPKSTKDICLSLRKDPLLALLVPSWACRTVPVPMVKNGAACLVFHFYPARGEAGKPKAIFPPVSQVVVEKTHGKVVQFASAPIFWPPSQRPDQPIGEYPPHGLRGLSVEQADALYEAYYRLCDQILSNVPTNDLTFSSAFADWRRTFDCVREDGFDVFMPPGSEIATSFAGRPVISGATAHLESPGTSRNPAMIPRGETQDVPADDMDTLFRDTRAFLTDAGLADLLPVFREISVSFARLHFTAAVIGEFSRGKSTLLNRLLDINLLPTGDVPTTAMLTRLQHGIRSAGYRIGPDRSRIPVDLTRTSLSQFAADQEGKDPEGVLQIEIANAWIADNNLVLYDTPGTADLFGRRAAITVEAITQCDASMIVISAPMPCSLTELEFLRDHVVAKKTPRVAAVLSKLDLIPVAERIAVINHVAAKLSEVSPAIELWVAHSRAEIPEATQPQITAAGPAEIRDRLSGWAADAGIQHRRNAQGATQLRELIRGGRALLARQMATAKASQEERERFVRDAKNALSREGLIWEDLAVDLERRALHTARGFAERLNKETDTITESLQYCLDVAPNPKTWWERDFPYLFRQHIRGRSQAIEKDLSLQLDEHEKWLRSEAQKRLAAARGDQIGAEKSLGWRMPETPEVPHLSDLERGREVARVGVIATAAAGYLLFGPLVALVSGGVGLHSEKVLKRRVEKERNESRPAVQKAVEDVLRDLAEKMQERILGWSRGVLDGIRKEAAAWMVAETKAVTNGINMTSDDVSRIQSLMVKADILLSKTGASEEGKNHG